MKNNLKTKELFGEFFEIFSRLESQLILMIGSLFLSFNLQDNSLQFISKIMNHSLHNSKIFPNIENKIQFFKVILKYLQYQAREKVLNITPIENILTLLKEIQKIQEQRNKLAHRWLIFDSNETIRMPKNNLLEKYENECIDLTKLILETKTILIGLERNHQDFMNIVPIILKK